MTPHLQNESTYVDFLINNLHVIHFHIKRLSITKMKEYKSIDSRSPGPGAYDANSSLEHRGAVTPRAARFSSREDKSPGPGSYSSSFLTPRNSGSGFGRSKRDDIFKPTPSPGPGSYDCSSTCFTGPSFSFPQKEIIAKLPNTLNHVMSTS